MHPQKILGIAASVRSARPGGGRRSPAQDLHSIDTKEGLVAYLSRQSQFYVQGLLQAERSEGMDFTAVCKDLVDVHHKLGTKNGQQGLSNSEAALWAALWAAHKEGADIDHLSLADHFTAIGHLRHPEVLRAKLLEAAGLLVSGPVYFGDRGSLAESLLQFIAADPELKEALRGRIYGGLAVAAKRNGGQETTLIYQMLDMLNLGLLAVGNDSETTAQYGGTAHAGDVGTMYKDSYGLDTSMGTGRRMARVLKYFGSAATLRDAPKVLFLILQDVNGIASRTVQRLVAAFARDLHPTVVDMTNRQVDRCLACDICPTRVGYDEEYRCAVTAMADSMSEVHKSLLYHELIVPVGVSTPEPVAGSRYQTFVERTRHIRRSDYIWGDVMVAPLILEEPGDYCSLPIRMMTSFLRHHTVAARPMVGYLDGGELTNATRVEDEFSRTLQLAARLAAGRLALAKEMAATSHYRTVGYVLSTDKDAEDDRLQRRRKPIAARRARLIAEAEKRLSLPPESDSPRSGKGKAGRPAVSTARPNGDRP